MFRTVRTNEIEYLRSRLMSLFLIVLLITSTGNPTSLWANSIVISNWDTVYGTSEPGCSNCHTGGVGNRINLSNYARELSSKLAANGSFPDDNYNRINRVSVSDLRSAMENIKIIFTPRVSSIAALEGSTVLTTQSSPTGTLDFPAETDGLRVNFTPGEDPFLSTYNSVQFPTVNNPGFSSTIPGSSISGANNVFTIPLPGMETRRANRQSAVQPYALTFIAENTMLFKDDPVTQPTNEFFVGTANFPPNAANDVFSPTLSEVHDNLGSPIPLDLDVLIVGKDFDPDHDDADLKVTNTLPVLAVADGSLAFNATRTGYIYTAPAVLDAAIRDVTFTYSVVDEEGAVSPAATVTINVPAALPPVPPKSFVANDDLFSLNEGGTLVGADVKVDNGSGADDLDGALLADVEFTAEDPTAGTLVFRENGTFDFTPEENFFGNATFTYRLADGTSFDEAEVTLRVAPINDPPAVTSITLNSVNESSAPITTDLLLSSHVSDLDGDELTVQNVTFTITQRPATPVRAIDRNAAVSISGNEATITPSAFSQLDNDEFADILINYEVTDGAAEPLPNTLFVTIIGLDNGLGRQAGAYADTLSERYVSADFGAHFDGQNSAPSACLTCHANLETVDADVDTVDQCRQTPNVFTAYGLELCLNRDAGAEALTDLVRRMVEAEPNYAPQLAATDTLQVLQSAARGTAIGAPLTASSNGRDVFGNTAQIHSYLISIGEENPPATTDPSGQFSIAANGQISVANDDLRPGSYTIIVLPVNDAGQRDDSGARISAPGFFSNTPGSESAVTIEVLGDLPTPVDDSINASINRSVEIAVLANDTGGDADSVTISTAPSNGSVVVNSDLTLTYTPEQDFVGEDSFSYSSRNVAGPSSVSANVLVTVVAAAGVVAVDDAVTAIKGRTTVIDVLANDENTRRKGNDASVVSITNRPDPDTVGRISLVGQSVSFTPATGFRGATSFSYRAVNPTAEGDLGSTASVSLNVIAVGEGAIANVVIDPELKKVARSLEQSCSNLSSLTALDKHSQQFLNVCALLTVAATEQEDLEQAMRALRNEEHFAAVDATAIVGRGLGRVIDRRLSQIRDGGARGFNTSAISLKLGGGGNTN